MPGSSCNPTDREIESADAYHRAEAIRRDAKFRAAMERAIAAGKERMPEPPARLAPGK